MDSFSKAAFNAKLKNLHPFLRGKTDTLKGVKQDFFLTFLSSPWIAFEQVE